MTIRVLSFDFDGCLFNMNYILSNVKDVVQCNRALLDGIKTEKASFSRVITLIGSNRQSKEIDQCNSFGKGSCFPAIQKIAEDLGVELDTFLLSDIYSDMAAGEAYKMAMNLDTPAQSHPKWIFDETKGSILYAQMQKIANENPNETIQFDFYDDREDILNALAQFYKTNPTFIPSNVVLHLHRYAGNAATEKDCIKGAGLINTNYRNTIKEMAEQVINARRSFNPSYDRVAITIELDPQALKTIKPLQIAPLMPKKVALNLPISQELTEGLQINWTSFDKVAKAFSFELDAIAASRTGKKETTAVNKQLFDIRNNVASKSQGKTLEEVKKHLTDLIDLGLKADFTQEPLLLKLICKFLSVIAALFVVPAIVSYKETGSPFHFFTTHKMRAVERMHHLQTEVQKLALVSPA